MVELSEEASCGVAKISSPVTNGSYDNGSVGSSPSANGVVPAIDPLSANGNIDGKETMGVGAKSSELLIDPVGGSIVFAW